MIQILHNIITLLFIKNMSVQFFHDLTKEMRNKTVLNTEVNKSKFVLCTEVAAYSWIMC
jgi:hypothetical protein